jgi:hypothetical protein
MRVEREEDKRGQGIDLRTDRTTGASRPRRRGVGLRPTRKVGFGSAVGLVLLLLIAVSSALGDSSSEITQVQLLSSEDILAGIEAGSTVPGPPESTEPAAADGVPHRDLGRAESLELMQGVFDAALQAPAGIFDELEVERFLSPTVAVLPASRSNGAESGAGGTGDGSSSEEGSPGGRIQADEIGPEVSGGTLLTSTTPLRTEGQTGSQEAIDLSLEPESGQLQPANPL